MHEQCYPELYYPEMYVLEGGYKKFWETPAARAFCEPQAYVPMSDSKFNQEMKNGVALSPMESAHTHTQRERERYRTHMTFPFRVGEDQELQEEQRQLPLAKLDGRLAR